MISQDEYNFLRREVTRWEEADLLQEGQGRKILSTYTVRSNTDYFLKTLTALGACLCGAALMSLIASNTQTIPLIWKFASLTMIMTISYLFSWRLRQNEEQNNLSEAAALLGSVLLGGIAVSIAQFFHLSGEEHCEIFIWGAGIAPVAVALRSRWSALLGVIVLSYSVSFAQDFGWQFFLPVLLSLVLSWVLQNPLCMALLLVAFITKLGIAEGPIVALSGLAVFLLHFILIEHRQTRLSAAYQVIGLGAALYGLFLSPFASSGYIQPCISDRLCIAIIFSAAAFIACLFHRRLRMNAAVIFCGALIAPVSFMALLSPFLSSYIRCWLYTQLLARFSLQDLGSNIGLACFIIFAIAAVAALAWTSLKTNNYFARALPILAVSTGAINVFFSSQSVSPWLTLGLFLVGAVLLLVLVVVACRSQPDANALSRLLHLRQSKAN